MDVFSGNDRTPQPLMQHSCPRLPVVICSQVSVSPVFLRNCHPWKRSPSQLLLNLHPRA